MMTKTFSLISAAVIGAGALTGLLLPSILPYPSEAPASTLVERARLVVEPQGVPALAAVEQGGWLTSVLGWLRDIAPSAGKQRSHLMLNQEVVVLKDSSGEQGFSLRKGTQVRLVANEGRFVRVSLGNKIVTVPRTALVTGIARTN